MRTIKLTLMYDGTDYAGWQIQPNGVAIQALVQAAVRTMTGEENDVVGASRTDAGVHALGQVAHFTTASGIPVEGFRSGLNSMLPEAIVVLAAEEAPEGFHARRSAQGKRYVYRLLISPERNPFLARRAWHLRRMPDPEAMRRAATCLSGEHDFTSFKASGCTSRHAVRTITRFEIARRVLTPGELAGEGELVEFTVEGTSFVRHMVRNIVGTLVDVGEGRIAPEEVAAILAARQRIEAGRCAPASGLCLVQVFY